MDVRNKQQIKSFNISFFTPQRMHFGCMEPSSVPLHNYYKNFCEYG